MVRVSLVAASIVLAAACGSGSGEGGASDGQGKGGSASVVLDGARYEVRDVGLVLDVGEGEDSWYRLDGEPVAHPDEDCVPGLSGGLGLYGSLPASVRQPVDLVGKRLPVEFSGDGDDANFCFVGMAGLAGAEDASVTITSVTGQTVEFSMTGTFKIYDENGEGPVRTATATGTATVRTD